MVCACGNGTAGAFSPQVLEAVGCEVVRLDCELDHTFPNYNPNTEDMKMLHAMRDEVLRVKADVALGFDGDGDRCGVVDNEGEEIFADKVGVMLARDMSALHPGATFVVDVKSTGLFMTDPVLLKHGAKTDYWKTGHSYMKRRVNEIGALAGFEKSGHFFFNKPIGRGYDDGLIFALAVCDMLDRNPGKSMADLKNALPKTWSSPTMSPHCDDEKKYGVVDAVVKHFEAAKREGRQGHRPADPRSRHRQRRARHGRGRHLGPGARLVQQAGAGGGGREPGVGGAHARDVQGGRRRAAHASRGRRVQSDDLRSGMRIRQLAATMAFAIAAPAGAPAQSGKLTIVTVDAAALLCIYDKSCKTSTTDSSVAFDMPDIIGTQPRPRLHSAHDPRRGRRGGGWQDRLPLSSRPDRRGRRARRLLRNRGSSSTPGRPPSSSTSRTAPTPTCL